MKWLVILVIASVMRFLNFLEEGWFVLCMMALLMFLGYNYYQEYKFELECEKMNGIAIDSRTCIPKRATLLSR